VDEGLADTAAFLNGYDMTGSHLTYQQVFHWETSLTRWGGGLENCGASFSYFAYLWEQAGGNGGGDLAPDLAYDDTAGDLLIKLVFAEQADGMAGVQAAIDAFNARTGAGLRPAEELFRDWAVTMYLDDEGSPLWDLANFDLGPASGGWTVDLANQEFWGDRGAYQGAQPEAKWNRPGRRPDGTALPFGVSYETFRNPGPRVSLEFDGEAGTRVAPHSGDTHWWGGYTSQSDTVLDVDTPVTGGQTVAFWNRYEIEEGWDHGFVEALVDGAWVPVPVTDVASGAVVSTDEDPHGNNEEGDALTGTSGGAYLVDEPEYVQYSVTLPGGAADVRFRYSTDAAYLDTGWFVDDVTVDGVPAALSSADWVETDGVQDNDWTVQVLAGCDLTPGRTVEGELVDGAGNHVYRFTGDRISTPVLDTRCANGQGRDFAVSVSNLPGGDLAVLDATYGLLGGQAARVTRRGGAGRVRRSGPSACQKSLTPCPCGFTFLMSKIFDMGRLCGVRGAARVGHGAGRGRGVRDLRRRRPGPGGRGAPRAGALCRRPAVERGGGRRGVDRPHRRGVGGLA
jgi:hypothetical protein